MSQSIRIRHLIRNRDSNQIRNRKLKFEFAIEMRNRIRNRKLKIKF